MFQFSSYFGLLISLWTMTANVTAFNTDTSRTTFVRTFPTARQMSFNPASIETDNEWYPHDPAFTTPQLLQGIWHQIAEAGTMVRGESMTVVYPEMQEKLSQTRFLSLLMAHLDSCKDVCDHFGITTTLVPYAKKGKIVGFTAKSFRNPDKKDDFEFEYDPFWDDGTDFDNLYAGVDDEDLQKDPYPEIINKIPDDDELIINITKAWTGKMMSDLGICPFTQGPDKAGLPIGDVFYCVDRSAGIEDVYSRYWAEVCRLEMNKEKDVSTILLILPEFLIDNVELFESFTNTLTQPLAQLDIEELLQLVFFHPQWSFRDGDARAGEGQAANYARRSPWPMINLLRTKQVRAAQKGIPTGLVYKQNEKTLIGIGVEKLETMLRRRDWGDIADVKVNRREYDALKIAQDYQNTGVVRKEDMSLAGDATPAANKVDRTQVEKGNLVNVVLQALEKRLGKDNDEMKQLTGPETSATAMASDVLIQELGEFFSRPGRDLELVYHAEGKSESEEESIKSKNQAATKKLADELEGDDDDMSSILFGGSTIPDHDDDDSAFNIGMNPNNFY